MLSISAASRFPQTHRVLLQHLDTAVSQLRALNATPSAFLATNDPVAHFNAYIDFGISTYAAKLLELFESVELSIENERYLIYALSGRAILENTATLRYYSMHPDILAASEAWKSKSLTDRVLRTANATLDRFLKGNRFSWDAFIEGRFTELTTTPDQPDQAQVNSTTCLQKWFKESSKLEPLYDLFCDLVHPNLGSNLLVLGTLGNELRPGAKEAKSASLFIVAPTLAGVIGSFETAKKSIERLAAQRFCPEVPERVG
jgi:hypothetical protein